MAHKLSNDTVLEQLRNGIAHFELVSSPVSSISTSISQANPPASFKDYSHRFFAKTGFPPGGGFSWNLGFSFDRDRSSAMGKVETVEYYSVQKITGDGRCLFRALVKGRAANEGFHLSPRQEIINAEELRMAVKEVICENEEVSPEYKAALEAITDRESRKRYCRRIQTPDFWGGKSELLVLSELLVQPIIVYEHTNGVMGSGFIPIDKYGSKYSEGSGNREPMKAVRLLKSGRNHYDLLVSETGRE